MFNNNSKNLYTALLHRIGCTHRDLKTMILERQFSPENIYDELQNASQKMLVLLGEKKFEKILQNLKKVDPEKFFQYIDEKNIRIKTLLDEDFPEKIRHIHQIPFIIYTLWSINIEAISIGIVWSRKNTEYGKNVLRKIFSEIPYQNVSIISGGAYGIDSLAHELALQHHLHTIAVFGCGIDIVYPKTNAKLFEKILELWGWLLSSFPIGSAPESYNFPIRNEIVAGLSDSILIPEAGIKSGTLITASLALDLGKDVFVVPWDIFRETSQGCNQLISTGEAKCTISASDIFEEFQPQISKNLQQNFLKTNNINAPLKKNFHSELGEMIFNTIKNGNNTIDSIISATNIPVENLTIELTMLELDGHISVSPTGIYEYNF